MCLGQQCLPYLQFDETDVKIRSCVMLNMRRNLDLPRVTSMSNECISVCAYFRLVRVSTWRV